jgi:hypothetical protein
MFTINTSWWTLDKVGLVSMVDIEDNMDMVENGNSIDMVKMQVSMVDIVLDSIMSKCLPCPPYIPCPPRLY